MATDLDERQWSERPAEREGTGPPRDRVIDVDRVEGSACST
jgi:hypothetical protein